MKLKPKFEYNAVQYIGTNLEEVKQLFHTNHMEILKVIENVSIIGESFVGIYYIDCCLEPKYVEIFKNYYLYVDDYGIVNVLEKEYAEKNYEVIRELGLKLFGGKQK